MFLDAFGGSASLVPFILVVALTLVIATLLLSSLFVGGGVGNKASSAQAAFSLWVRLGRLRNLLCSPCDRAASRYPLANTCQVPFFRSLSDAYTFVFGYKKAGLFVEVGAYDGESFSNTSGLADLGWEGHYLEPIPQYAAAAAARHAGNAPRVRVHTVAVGERDGEAIQLSTAGPFTSASRDEIDAVAASGLHKTLNALGWGHEGGVVHATTVSLNTFFAQQGLRPGAVDVMVVDVEGCEAPILRAFDLARWAPKLVIVEIQELQARYRDSAKTQAEAAELFAKFAASGYAILYKDVVNTIFIHKACKCVGGA